MSSSFDRRAEHAAAIGVEQRRIDDLRIRELALDLGDTALDKALAFLGGRVFGIFGKVPVGARLGDRGDDGRPPHGLQLVQLGAQLLCANSCQWNFAHLRSVG